MGNDLFQFIKKHELKNYIKNHFMINYPDYLSSLNSISLGLGYSYLEGWYSAFLNFAEQPFRLEEVKNILKKVFLEFFEKNYLV